MRLIGVSRPYGTPNGKVLYRMRLVIEAPDKATIDEAKFWLDDYDPQFDCLFYEDYWTANEQLTADQAPHVRMSERAHV